MLSLQQQLLEKLQKIPDLGECKPNSSRIPQVSPDSFISITNLKNPDYYYKTYFEYLTSDKVQLKLWALYNFPKAIQRDNHLLNLVSYVFQNFESKEQIIEYNAILCASSISEIYGVQIASSLLPNLIKRLNSFPSIEYVNCLKNLLPSIEIGEIKRTILPTLIEFIKKNEHFQHAAGMILTFLPLSKIGLTSEIIDSFLISPIFIANYLSPVINCLSKTSNKNDLISSKLIQKLLPIINSRENTREGAVDAVLQGIDNINDQQIYIFVLTAFNWAASNDFIALILIRHSDTILTRKHTDFPSKLREFASRISSSNNVNNRVRLCDELGKCHLLFRCIKGSFRNIFKIQAEDQDPDVRLKFLANFSKLFVTNDANDRDFFCKLLVPFFSDSNVKIQEFLMSNQSIYANFQSHIKIIAPLFLKLFEKSVAGNQWRNVASCMKTCVSFTDEIIKSYSPQICSIVNAAASKWPHPLSDNIVIFFVKIFQSSYSCELVHLIIEFSQSQIFYLRVIFIKIAFALSLTVSFDLFISNFWPKVLALQNDPVASVRVAFLAHLPRFRSVFKKFNDNENKSAIDSIFESMKEDKDPYVQETIKAIEGKTQFHYKYFNDDSLNLQFYTQTVASVPLNSCLKNLPKISLSKSDYGKKKTISSPNPSSESRASHMILRRSSFGKKYPSTKPSVTTTKAQCGKSRLPSISQV